MFSQHPLFSLWQLVEKANFHSTWMGTKSDRIICKINLVSSVDTPSCEQPACVDVQEETSTCSHQRALCLEQLRKSILVKTLVVLAEEVLSSKPFLSAPVTTNEGPSARKEVSQLRLKSDIQHCSHIAQAGRWLTSHIKLDLSGTLTPSCINILWSMDQRIDN